MTNEQLIGACVWLDREQKKSRAMMNSYKAELQARGLAIMEDHNVKYVKFYGDEGSAAITDSMSLDILNPDKLKELVGEGVYKMKVKEETKTTYKFDSKFEKAMKAIFTGDYTFETTLEEFSNMGEAAALHPDELVFGAMMSGFNEKCYDGLSFFNTAHKVGDATYSNRSNKKLSRESYMEGRSSIMSIKGDKGKSLKLVPDLLVVPPALEETARLILEADQIDGTTNVLKGTAKLHVEPALAEHPEYWFLLCTNRFLKPFIYQLRKKIKFTSLTRDTDENVFMLDEYLYGADGRSNAGYGFWQMAYGSTGEVEAQAQG